MSELITTQQISKKENRKEREGQGDQPVRSTKFALECVGSYRVLDHSVCSIPSDLLCIAETRGSAVGLGSCGGS